MSHRTLIIAEAGVNHNGDLSLAHRLVDFAADAGADLVKFQTFNAKRLVTASAQKADYQKVTTGSAETQLAMLERLELSESAHQDLMAHCQRRGIRFFSTGFDIECMDMLVSLGQTLFKVPSGELTNLPYLRHIGALGGDVILSTGMANLSDVESALLALEASGTPRERVTVLHCTTEYPTAPAEVNLRAMRTMGEAFGVRVGYSDHTSGIEIAIAAVALGATVIEKHFTIDRSLPGPDHQASLEPGELAAMVRCIRNVELALGSGIKRPTDSEERNRTVARKSIVASRAIAAGEVLCESNLTVKRPAIGLSPMRWDEILGRRAGRAYAADEPIEL